MIDRDHKFSITRQARLLNISRGTVYYLPQPVSPADLALMRRIDELPLRSMPSRLSWPALFSSSGARPRFSSGLTLRVRSS